MREATQIKIFELAAKNGGYLRTIDLKNNKISPKHLAILVEDGALEKVSYGLYRLAQLDWAAYEDFIAITKRIPQGVICSISALDYYELSTINPGAVHLCVRKNSNIVRPTYPPVEFYYQSNGQFELGITEIAIRGERVRIYSPEKTICDCIKYRNRIGMDIMLEAVKNYTQRKDRDLGRLFEYSRKCRVEKLLTNYMEVLI
jgi:predicted transcriptional regulator of viral defense system